MLAVLKKLAQELQTALSDLQRNVGTLLGPIGAAFQKTFTEIVKFINSAIVALNNFLGIGLEGAVNKAQREVDSALKGFARFEDVNRDELDQRGKAAFDRAKRELDLSNERLEKAKSALASAAKGKKSATAKWNDTDNNHNNNDAKGGRPHLLVNFLVLSSRNHLTCKFKPS